MFVLSYRSAAAIVLVATHNTALFNTHEGLAEHAAKKTIVSKCYTPEADSEVRSARATVNAWNTCTSSPDRTKKIQAQQPMLLLMLALSSSAQCRLQPVPTIFANGMMAHTTCRKTSLQAKYVLLLPAIISQNAGSF